MINQQDANIMIGQNLREARNRKGLSLAALGVKIKISAQQIQKYETGQNRVSASTLWQFAEILQVSISFFFDNPPNTPKKRTVQ